MSLIQILTEPSDKILAPNLLSENYLNNYMEIQDFGDQTLFEILKPLYATIHFSEHRNDSQVNRQLALTLANEYVDCRKETGGYSWRCLG